jgi:hypothetical protein
MVMDQSGLTNRARPRRSYRSPGRRVVVTLDGFDDAGILIEGVTLTETSAENLFFTEICC